MSTPSNQINWSNFRGAERTSYDPFVAASQLPDPNEGIGALDYVKHFTSEAVNLTTSVLWLGAKGIGADSIADNINDLGRVATDYWHDSMSEDAQYAASQDMVRKTDDGSGLFGYEWADPSLHTVGLAAAGSLFGTGAGMGAGALATKGITKVMQVFGNPAGRKVLETAVAEGFKAGATEAAIATGVQAGRKLKLIAGVTGAAGFGLGEGGISGVSTTKSVYDQIMALDHDKLIQNDRYRMVYDSAEGMDELERHKYAADTVAFEAGTEAGLTSGFTTSLLGAPMGAYFGRLLGGNLTRQMASTLPRGIAAGASGEAAQEFLQSGSEQMLSNIARQPFEPDLDKWEGVLNSAISGALAGGLLGGATGPMAVSNQKKGDKFDNQVEAQRVADRIGGDLKDAATSATQAGVDRRHTSDILDRLLKEQITSGEAIIEIKTLEHDLRKRQGQPPLPADRTPEEQAAKEGRGTDIDYGPGDKAQETHPVSTTAAPKITDPVKKAQLEYDDAKRVAKAASVGDTTFNFGRPENKALLRAEDRLKEATETAKLEEYKQKAQDDFEQYGVSDRNRASVVEALNKNVGEEAGAAYDTTYQKLVDQAVAERQKQKPKIQPVRPRPKPTDEIVSRTPEQVQAATALISSRPKGTKRESFAGSTPVNTQYQLTEAEELITSHTPEGKAVPIYPTELQPRDRSRAASKEWLTDKAANFRPELLTEGPGLAEGAPLISEDGIVESGNGRVMLLNHIYKNNPEAAAQYKAYLKANAASFGLTPEQVDSLKQPILARTRLDKMSGKQLQELTQAANVTETASLSPVEQANMDAGNISDADLENFTPDESGNVLAAGNDSFVKAFLGRMTAAERGKVMTPQGQPTKQLADRIQSAIFAKAYADDRVLALMAEDTNPDVKNIVNALVKAAPAFARARAGGELGDLNIVDPLLDAVEVVRAARSKGLAMSEYQAQGDLLGDTDPLVNALATFLDKNIRSPKRMAEAMSQMGAFIEKEVDSKKNASLFGQERGVGLADVIEAADRYMTQKYGDTASVATGLREGESVPGSEPAPAPTKVKPANKKAFDEVLRAQQLAGTAWQRETKNQPQREGELREKLPGLLARIEKMDEGEKAALREHYLEEIKGHRKNNHGIPAELYRPLGFVTGPTIREAEVGDVVQSFAYSSTEEYRVIEKGKRGALVESVPATPAYTFKIFSYDLNDTDSPFRGHDVISNLANTLEEAKPEFDRLDGRPEVSEDGTIYESLAELTQDESWNKLQEHYGLADTEMNDLRKVIASSPWVTQEGEQTGLEFRMELEQVVSNYADGLAAPERLQGDDYRAYFHNKAFSRAETYPLTDTDQAVLEGPAPLDYKIKPEEEIFPKPEQRFHASKVATEVLSAEEGAARVQEWKDEAARIGREEDHSQEVILSLFDHSGRWSQPYADAGYDVRRYDYFDGDDLLLHAPTGDIIDIHQSGKRVVGVLAACPCTSFSASGARWWKTQHDVPSEDMVAKKFGEAAAKHFDTPLEYSQFLVEITKVMIEITDPQFHALENPRGRIARMTGINDPRLTFDPNNYGDPYTKETKLWGEFNAELPQANVEPTEGSLIHSLRGDVPEQKALRSLTPEGFAYAFFMANSTATKPAETATTTEQETLFSRTPNANQGDMFGPTPEMNPAQPQAPTDTRPMVDTLTAEQVEAELEQFEKQRVRIAQQFIRDRVSPMFATAGNRYEYGTKDNDLRVAALHNRASSLQSQETLTQRGMFNTEELHGYNVLYAKLRRAGKNPSRDMTLQQLQALDAETVSKKGIQDLGEKIGGARKDLAPPGKPRGTGPSDGRPAWMKKYTALPETVRGDSFPVDIRTFIDEKNYPLQSGQKHTGTWALFREGAGRFGHRKIKGGFDSKEDAEQNIPLAEVIRKHGVGPDASTDPETFQVYRRVTKRKTIPVKAGFETREEAMTYLATNPLEVLKYRPPTPERPHLEELERYGETHRKGDVSPDKFMAEFGFRGAEFGNWLPQDERQEVLNRAYDAMMDMANVLQVPPKALSLNGALAIGFGSRGQGLGKAKAHFELDRNVINLTRIRGAGSLAHEWFHAFDAYLAKQDTKAEDKYSTYKDPRTGETVKKLRRKSKARTKEDSFVSFGFSYDSKTRDDLRAAFTKVNKTIRRRQKEFDKNIDQLERFATRYEMQMLQELQDIETELGQTKDSRYYKRKNKPATPAQMKKLKALSLKILEGNPGKESYVQGKGWRGRNTFDAVEQISVIYKDVRGRTGFREHGRLTRLLGTISGKRRADSQVELAKKVNKETRTVSTDYYSEAAKLDRARVGDYYSTPHELGARAFESFMYDALAANEARSDYLVHSVTNDLYMPGVNPYPDAEERTAISAAFAELFDTIKAAAPDAEGRVALFSRSGATGKPLGSVQMKETAMIEETGELIEIESDAATLLRQVDQRIANIEKIGECLRS